MIIAALAGIKVLQPEVLVVCIAERNIPSIFLPIYRNWQIPMSLLFVRGKIYSRFRINNRIFRNLRCTVNWLSDKSAACVFCRTSPFDVSIRLDSAREIARAMAVKWQTGLNGGLVVANPIPEQFAMPEETINAAIDQAVAEAEEQGVIGKESTPFLLARVAELTGGDSLKSNIQLVFNNAILASEIAKEYQRLVG